MSAQRSWLEVLASLEAHADTTELLLASNPVKSTKPTDREHQRDPAETAIAPWEWVLPKTDELPPLPTELQDRALAIRDRMIRLQGRLVHELDQMPPSVAHPRPKTRESRSVYIDLTV